MASQAPRDLENRLKILLIAPWGNPRYWVEQIYRPPAIPEKCRPAKQEKYGEGFGSRSSTLAIAKQIEKVGEPSIVIIASESLADKRDLDECKSTNPGKPKECIDTRVLGKIWDFIKTSLQQPPARLYIKIAPAIGIFPETVFRGHANNYKAYTLIETLKIMEETDPDIVMVDTTHGINYMPIAALEAVREAAEIHLLRKKNSKRIKILAVNSDPVPGTPREPQELYIHIISCEEIDTERARDKAYREIEDLGPGGFIVHNRIREQIEAEEKALITNLERCSKGLEETLKDLKALIRSTRLGLPIAIAIQARDIAKHGRKPCIVQSVREALESIRIRDHGGRAIVERSIAIKPEALATALTIEALIEDIITIGSESSKVREEAGSILFTIEHLEGILDQYVVDEVADNIASHELSDIKDRLECVKHSGGYEVMKSKGTPIPWGAIYDATEKAVDRDQSFIDMCRRSRSRDSYRPDQELASKLREELEKSIKGYEALRGRRPCTYGDPQPRNFYAHAGFEKNVAMVYIDREDRVWIGYEKGCWEGKIRGMIAGSS